MRNQIILAFAGVVLVLIFFYGFTNKPPHRSAFDTLGNKLIDSLALPQEDKIIALQHDLKKASGSEKISALNELASVWMKAGYLTIAGDYLRQKADAIPDYNNYMDAGNLLLDAMNTDTTQQMRVNVVYGSRYCYEKALELQPDDLDARIGLATVLVQGTSQPMQGIQMLREIDEQHPGNIKVNTTLGNFSIMSGQFDKAIERFTAVLQKDSLNLQSRYFLAEAYLGKQDTAAAIKTLENGLLLVQDAKVAEGIRQDINNLKNH